MVRRILLVSASQTMLPGELLAGDNEIVAVDDQTAVIEKAISETPEYVILPSGNKSLQTAQEIMDALPSERWPAFLIGVPPQYQSRRDAPQVTDGRSTDNDGPRYGTDTVHRINCHGLQLDRQKVFSAIDGRELDLTLMEFLVLWELAVKPGHVQSRDDLITKCCSRHAAVGRRTIDQHIRSLRKKMGRQGDLIETVRGLGYRFRDCVLCSV